MLRPFGNYRQSTAVLPATSTSGQSSTSRKKMSPGSLSGRLSQLPLKWMFFVAFLIAYCIFTFRLSSFHHTCPTVEDDSRLGPRDVAPMEGEGGKDGGGASQDDHPADLVGALERLAQAYNDQPPAHDSVLLRKRLEAPLAKLGIRLPELLGQNAVKATATPPSSPPPPPSPPPTQFANEMLAPDRILDPSFAPSVAFYVWCGRRWFEFQHYLSVKSVMRAVRPDVLLFYYDAYPVVDQWSYNTWFDELRHELPFLRLIQVAETDKACAAWAKPNMEFVHKILTEKGGMFVSEFTIVAEFPIWYRNHSMVDGLDKTSGLGLLMTQRGLPGVTSLEQIANDPLHKTRSLQCETISHFVKSHRKPPCVLTGDPFFPNDLWELDNSFGRLARRIFYGTSEIRRPERNYDDLIPNIAHVVWIGGGEMDYLFYLSVLSLIYVAEVDRVYLHGDAPPTGPYWDSIKNLEKLTMVYREVPGTVYQTPVNVLSHVTDIWRVDFMIKYGGIYVDTDTIFLKPLDRDIRAYDAVGSYDWTYWNHPFPDTINFGVAIGKRNATYWHRFQESMRWFMDQDWAWNGLRQPYRIKERNPELVLIDPHLQVICFESKCHPTWWPNYHNESIHHLNSPSIRNWREDAYAFHWTLPTPYELLNEDNLMRSNSIFAEIGKNVLQKAGRLKSG